MRPCGNPRFSRSGGTGRRGNGGEKRRKGREEKERNKGKMIINKSELEDKM